MTKKSDSKKKNINYKSKKRNINWLLILILILLAIFIILRIVNHYDQLKNHRVILKNPDIKIESWMPITALVKNYHIPPSEISKILNTNITPSQGRMTIDQVCKKNHLNCSEVIKELNELNRR